MTVRGKVNAQQRILWRRGVANDRRRLVMSSLEEQSVCCPYCAETLAVLIDAQEIGHEYIEDCQVCCRPIVFNVSTDAAGHLCISVRDENASY